MSDSLTITGLRVYEYHMPMKIGFGTSRGVVDHARNLVISLEADRGGEKFHGIGESVPRGPKITGDTLDGSWSYVVDAAATLEGRRLPVGSAGAALDAVRDVERELHGVAATHATRLNRAKPYRGTLAGLDVALLDLVARARRQSVAELLGVRRDRVGVSAGTISTVSDHGEIERRTRRIASNFPMSRFKASGDLEEALDLTALIARTNREAGAVKPVWVDVNEGFSPDDARRYVERVVAEMLDGSLPPHVIVEQPVAKKSRDVLAELQQMADQALSDARTRGLRARWASRRSPSGPLVGPMKLTVIADESLWDAEDYRALIKLGGTRGINIKVPKIGGVLPAHDLALEAVQDNPEIELYIGGMLGTSDLTAWALHNLARAMPRLDYFTSTPPANVDARIAEPHMRYRDQASRQLTDQVGDGIGAALSGDVIGEYVTRSARFPRPAPSMRVGVLAHQPNSFDLPHLDHFGSKELDGHLLEAEALRAGLNTVRSGRQRFAAVPDGPGEPITFASPATGAAHAAGGETPESGPRGAGDVYEFIVVDKRVVSVLHRRPLAVHGDGVSTVTDLISQTGEVCRGVVRHHVHPLRVDAGVRAELEPQGLSWDSVLELGQRVVVDLPDGHRYRETVQVVSEVHPSLVNEAVRAAGEITGAAYAGVDFVIADHRKPLLEQDAAVRNVHARPVVAAAHFPLHGPPVNVAREVISGECARHGIELGERADELHVDLTVRGRVQQVGYRQWMRTNADAFGVSVRVRNTDDPNVVEARLSGGAGPVAALASLAIKGPRKAKPTSVEVRHAPAGH